MHRIDSSNALPGGLFTEGDPVTPVAATEVSAEWLNAVQEEIAAVILAAGIALAKPNNAQLLAAIQALLPKAATTALAGLVELATASETAALTDGTRAVTPLGLAGVLPGAASDAVYGLVRLATAAQASPLTNSTAVLTPAVLGTLFATSQTATGYQSFPGKVTLQWGRTTVAQDASVTVTLPLAFFSMFFSVVATPTVGTAGAGVSNSAPVAVPVGLTQFTLTNDNAAQDICWIAVGR